MVGAFVVLASACSSSEIRPAFIDESNAPPGSLPGTVVFASQSRTSRGLFALDPSQNHAGRRAVAVTPEELPARSPAVAPDGARLAYAVDDAEEGGIVISTLPDGQARPIVQGPGLFDGPSWSPDGRQLTYAYNVDESGSWDLYSVDIGSGAKTLLTTGPSQDWHPAWSPDGKQIAFTSDRDGDNAIWMLDVATKALRKVVDSTAGDEQPAWSPDGTRLVFSSNRELERWQLFLLDVTTGREERLIRSDTVDRYPSFSPDGRYVLFSMGYLAVYRADGSRFPGGADRWKLNGRVAYGATWSPAPAVLPVGPTP